MSTVWGKKNQESNSDASIAANFPQEEVSLADVMSEQYASFLMEQDDRVVAKNIADNINKLDDQAQAPDQAGPSTSCSASSSSSTSVPFISRPSAYKAPLPDDSDEDEDEDETTTNNDLLLAQLLQQEFDKEYDEHLQRQERHLNGTSKVNVSFDKFRRTQTGSLSDSDEELEKTEQDEKKRVWDSFDKAEREESGLTLNRRGFVKSGLETRTKHDLAVCGRRNACKLMGFDLSTGDCGGFDVKLNNNVYNVLKVHSKSENKRAARLREKKEKSSVEHVMDEKTRLILYKLVNRGILDEINGAISTGKESHVYHGIGGDPEKKITCGEVAIKVYKTTLNEFKNREAYIKDDHRFKDKFSRQNPRKIIHLWAEKEMHNLARIQRAGIPCPTVVMLKEHILVMKFIGNEGKHAPSLKDAPLSSAQLIKAYSDVQEIMKKMYTKCELIHGDLSEYNLLWYMNKIWVIDVSQSVLRNHPNALHFLARDCHNITNFFVKSGLENTKTEGQLFYEITGKEFVGHNLENLDHLSNLQDYEKDEEILTYGITSREDNFDELFNMISKDKHPSNSKLKQQTVTS